MTISDTDLFMAILSMDAYNRGYDRGIALPGNTVGSATITADSSILTVNGQRLDIPAGFYAAAYDTQWGTVISYRGTDISRGVPYYDDVVNGWAFAVGDFTADQLELSTAFLEQVVRTNGFDITLTGHSLGGGLGARH